MNPGRFIRPKEILLATPVPWTLSDSMEVSVSVRTSQTRRRLKRSRLSTVPAPIRLFESFPVAQTRGCRWHLVGWRDPAGRSQGEQRP